MKKEEKKQETKQEEEKKVKVKKENKIIRFFKKLGFKWTLIIVVVLIVFFVILKNSIPEIFHNSITNIENYYIKDNNLYYNEEKIGNDIYDVSYAEEENVSLDKLDKISELNFKPIYDKNKSLSIYLCNYNIDKKTADLKIEGFEKNFTNDLIKNVDKEFIKVSRDINSVIYLKNENNKKNLYFNDFENEKLIAEDVKEFYANYDLTLVYYIKGDDFYIYENEDNVLIATDSEIIKEESEISFDEVLNINNYNFLYYKKYTDRNHDIFDIYKLTKDISEKKVEAAAGDVICYYNEDYIYFNKSDIEELKVSDYVNDDISDGTFYKTEPNINDYRSSFFFSMIPDYFSYYSDKASYDSVINFINRNKDTFDRYVRQIERGTFNNYYMKLMTYDAGNIDSLGEQMIKNIFKVNTDDPYILFTTYEIDELEKIEKVNLSDIIKNNLSVNNYMKTVRKESKTFTYLYHKNEGARIIELDTSSEKTIYKLKSEFLVKSKNGSNQYLYRINFIPNAVCRANRVAGFLTNDIEVFTSENSDDIYYAVMYGNNNSYFYKNEDQIENKVHTGYIKASKDLNKIYYFTDYDDNKKMGTLKIYEIDKKRTIEQNVLLSSLKIDLENTDIYYIKDYNEVAISGTLYRYDNFNRRHEIDDDTLNYIEDNKNFYINKYKKKDTTKTNKTTAGEDLGENNYQEF